MDHYTRVLYKYLYDKVKFSSSFSNKDESCSPPNMGESESIWGMEDSKDEEALVDLKAEHISSLDKLREEIRSKIDIFRTHIFNY